jgi:DNA-binding NarL/FixJ family response regulator
MAPIQVLIVAEDALSRYGLSKILSDQDGLKVIGAFQADQFSQADLELYQPDILLWDMGRNNGPVLDHILGLELGIQTRMVILAPENDQALFWNEHISGILSRNVDEAQLLASLRAVALGLMVFEPEFGRMVSSRSPSPAHLLEEDLTGREIEVLSLVGEGLSNKTIALRLSISEHTVKFHINSILGKLGAQSRTDAVVRASRLGLITL